MSITVARNVSGMPHHFGLNLRCFKKENQSHVYRAAVMAVSINIITSFRFVNPGLLLPRSGHPLRARLSAVSSSKDAAAIRDAKKEMVLPFLFAGNRRVNVGFSFPVAGECYCLRLQWHSII